MKFRVEFRCKKRRKFSAEFPSKFDAKKMKIYGKPMKIDTRKPTFEKRGSEVRFLMDFMDLGSDLFDFLLIFMIRHRILVSLDWILWSAYRNFMISCGF